MKLLDKIYKYEMDPTRTIGATEQTWDAGWTGRTDGPTDGVKPIYPPHQQLRCAGGMIKMLQYTNTIWLIPWGRGCLAVYFCYPTTAGVDSEMAMTPWSEPSESIHQPGGFVGLLQNPGIFIVFFFLKNKWFKKKKKKNPRVWHRHTRTHRETDAGNDNTRRPKLASSKNE